MDLPNEIRISKKTTKEILKLLLQDENIKNSPQLFLQWCQQLNISPNPMDWDKEFSKEPKMDLPNEIMELLKKHAKNKADYINPHFLNHVAEALCTYYNLEDDEVDTFIQKMWSR